MSGFKSSGIKISLSTTGKKHGAAGISSSSSSASSPASSSSSAASSILTSATKPVLSRTRPAALHGVTGGAAKGGLVIPPPKRKKLPSVFNDSDDSEPEEMPAEARIRMRNIGKHTPTSAGPNSYGKTTRGFTDRRAELEKQLREQLEKASSEADQQPLAGKRRSNSFTDPTNDAPHEAEGHELQSVKRPRGGHGGAAAGDSGSGDTDSDSRSTGCGGGGSGRLGGKIYAIKDSFTDTVQDVHADEDEADS